MIARPIGSILPKHRFPRRIGAGDAAFVQLGVVVRHTFLKRLPQYTSHELRRGLGGRRYRRS